MINAIKKSIKYKLKKHDGIIKGEKGVKKHQEQNIVALYGLSEFVSI